MSRNEKPSEENRLHVIMAERVLSFLREGYTLNVKAGLGGHVRLSGNREDCFVIQNGARKQN